MTPLPAAVLFDMDGTLLDSEGLWLIAEERTIAGLGGTWTSADQEACLGGPLERVVAYMLDRANRPASEAVQVCDALLGHIESLFRSEPIRWRPGARDLLAQTRALGVPTALVTASWRRLIDAVHDAIAADLGEDPFDVIIGGDEVSNGKPHPEPYLMAAARLAVPIGRCLAIEDSPTGIAAGVAAGAVVIAVPHLAPAPLHPAVVELPSLVGVDLPALWALGQSVSGSG